MPKDYISKKIKILVWERDCHPRDDRVAQCCSCEELAMVPKDIRKKKELDDDILPWDCVGIGEFGHIISENNGGKIHVDNLRIQCKPCNTKLGSKNLILTNPATRMLDCNHNDNTSESISTEQCCQILKNNKRCKNNSYPNRRYCGIHLKN